MTKITITKLYLLVLLVTALFFNSTFANSQATNTPQSRNGFYFGISGGQSEHNPPTDASGSAKLINLKGEPSFGIFAGYQFNPHIAMQVGYTAYQFTNNAADNIFGADHQYFNAIDLLAKPMLPINNRLSLNGYLGLSILNEDTYNKLLVIDKTPLINRKKTAISPEIGAGIEFYPSKYVSIGTIAFYTPGENGINDTTYYGGQLSIHI